MNLRPVKYEDKRKGFMDYWKNLSDNTLYAGFECIKERYSFDLGGCTDLTGFSHSGKTEVAMEIQFALSELYGFRHALYVPDVGKYNEIRRKLVQKRTGRGFKKEYPNYIQEHEIIHSEAWVDHHFLVLEKIDIMKPVTPMEFWNFTATYKDAGGPLQTGLMDAWKNLFHDKGTHVREDLYLDYVLSQRNEIAEQANKHFFTIAHPTKTEIEDDRDNQGKKKRRIPDANDIKGGPSWFANGKVIMTVDRPDKMSNQTDLYFSKVKPDTIGVAGVVIDKLYFNWAKSRFYEKAYGREFYAGELKKELEQTAPSTSINELPEFEANNPLF